MKQALVDFTDRRSFKASIMFHGGAVVCNTVWDNCYGNAEYVNPGTSDRCPEALAARADDKAFTRSGLAAAYARACPNVGRGVDAQSAADDALGLLEAAGLLGPAPDKRTKAAKRTAPGQAKLRVLVDPEDARKALGAHAKSSALAHLPPGAK